MISNELYDGQGLGNQLWNYALLRILAKNRGCPFSVIGKERFKGKEFMEIDFGVDAPKAEHYYKEKSEYLSGTGIDISRTDQGLLDILPSTKFDGNCQSTKYLDGHRDSLIEWIKIQEAFKIYTTDDNVCVIHFRSGDFKKIRDVFLPADYYKHAMDHIRSLDSSVRFCCVTDEKEEAMKMLPGVEVIGSALIGETDASKASHHHGGPIGIDFSLLAQARYLIIPNSSFSWWAAYLNTAKKAVVAPKYWARHNVSDGYWSTSDIITDDFTYIDRSGNAFSSEECWEGKTAYESTHPDMFSPIPKPDSLIKRILRRFT